MNSLETMRSIDLETCLNDCRQRQYPFTFWNETEVGMFDLSNLPVLNLAPRGWDLRSSPYIVTLDNPQSIKEFKSVAVERITARTDELEEVAFAITKTKKNTIYIQIYFQ